MCHEPVLHRVNAAAIANHDLDGFAFRNALECL
jgi:hypothetical protein